MEKLTLSLDSTNDQVKGTDENEYILTHVDDNNGAIIQFHSGDGFNNNLIARKYYKLEFRATIADNKIVFVMYSGDTIRLRDFSLVEMEEYSGVQSGGDQPHTFIETETALATNIGLGASY